MSSLNEPKLDADKPISEELEQQSCQVLPKDSILTPSIKTWHLSNLKQNEVDKAEKVRSDVLDKLRKEVEPQVEKQASIIKKNAYEEAYRKGSDEGFKQGLQSGKLEGKKQALKEAEEALLPKVKSLQEITEFMATPYQEISEEVFLNLVKMVTEISSKIIKKEISEDSAWILAVIKESVAKLPSETSSIEIYLNPEDLEIVKEYAENKTNWILSQDNSLNRGCCRVKQDSSSLVNDWQKKIEILMEQTKAVTQEIVTNPKKDEESLPEQSTKMND